MCLLCFWASPAPSFSGPSPAEHVAIFYCQTWRTRFPYLYPPGTGWPSCTPGHWVPFSSPLTTRRVTRPRGVELELKVKNLFGHFITATFSSYFATDGQSASPFWCRAPDMTRFLLLSDICGLHVVGSPP
jgi:hypothetical protein